MILLHRRLPRQGESPRDETLREPAPRGRLPKAVNTL